MTGAGRKLLGPGNADNKLKAPDPYFFGMKLYAIVAVIVGLTVSG